MAADRRAHEGAELARTNVVLDTELVHEAMRLTGLKTKRGVLDEALRTLVAVRRQDRVWELFGSVGWTGDLGELRRGRTACADR
jgi:Arc/MetJ family transcription regulator